MEKVKNTPMKPKDASTLIIVKKENNKTLVLMGQRSFSSRFMPGVYVFPGGVAEQEDLIACKSFKLKANPYINYKNLKARSNIHALSLMLAGIRETAEETGLYLVQKNNKYNIKSFINSRSTWDFFKKILYA